MTRMQAQSVSQFLDSGADGPCLIDGGSPIGFAQLRQRSQSVAAGLAALGIKPGDRVALWLPNRSAWLEVFFACARLGAIAVSINTRFRSAEVSDLLFRSRASVLVYWPGYKEIDFTGILGQCGADSLQHLNTVVLYSEDSAPAPATAAGKVAVPFSQLRDSAPMTGNAGTPDSPCVIFTTSGTTKAPKLVLHKQSNVLAHARNVAAQYSLGPSKKFLLLPPFCGVYGFCSAWAALVSRSLLVLEHAWNPPQFADLIEQHGITHFTASNEALAQLFDCRPEGRIFPSLELLGQANLNPAHADIVERGAARGIVMAGLYGSSEMQAVFSLCDPAQEPAVRGRAGGVPASALTQMRARDPESGRLCAVGEAGELELKAPESAFVGYFENPEATAAAFTEDGFFKTGDLGFIEANGAFTYLARMGDTLRLGGFLVSPAEIEAVVQDHPSIESCQVVGARTREAVRPVAFVIAKAGAQVDEAAVIAFVSERLAKYKVPIRVFGVAEFPTTPSANGSKVQKTKLRDMAEALLGQ